MVAIVSKFFPPRRQRTIRFEITKIPETLPLLMTKPAKPEGNYLMKPDSRATQRKEKIGKRKFDESLGNPASKLLRRDWKGTL